MKQRIQANCQNKNISTMNNWESVSQSEAISFIYRLKITTMAWNDLKIYDNNYYEERNYEN